MSTTQAAPKHFFEDVKFILRNYRRVRIYFLESSSKDRKTLYAPACFLTEVSERLHHMLRNAVVAADEFFKLVFVDDDYEAWQSFLYWLIDREIPKDVYHDQEPLVRCWVLGETFVIFDFMSDVILCLMQLHERNENSLSAQAIQIAFCGTHMSTLDGSKLRMLIAEEIVKGAIRNNRGGWEHIQHIGLPGCSRDHKGQACGLQDLVPSIQRAEVDLLA